MVKKVFPEEGPPQFFLVASAINVITSATSGNYPESFRIHEFCYELAIFEGHGFSLLHRESPMLGIGIVNLPPFQPPTTTSQANGPRFQATSGNEPSQDPIRFFLQPLFHRDIWNATNKKQP